MPGYSAVLVRRAFSHLNAAGGLIPMSREWLSGGEAKFNSVLRTWTFPSGATLSFAYLDSDRDLDLYQGAEYQMIGVDESTQVPEHRLRYLFSRLRKPGDMGVPVRVRFATNPGGVSHEFHRQRFIVEGDSDDRRYIPATLQDNPSLNGVEYLKSLEHLDPLTRQRLLAGDWDAVAEGGMFRREWFDVIERWQLPPNLRPVRYWDRASTIPRPGSDPDWTAGALLACDRGVWYVLDLQRFRGSSSENERRIKATAETDGRRVPIWMEQEPGSSGKDVIDHYARNVLRGYTFRSTRPTGNKAERAAPVASAAEQGLVKLCSGRWVSDFLDEVSAFPMGPHDDQVDALSGAFGVLTQRPGRIYTFRVKGL